MNNCLLSVSEAARLVQTGRVFLFAGAAEVLDQLPVGNWIGGTIPYFMSEDGGQHETTRLFVTELPVAQETCRFTSYTPESISQVAMDADPGVLTFIILPGFSTVHQVYAKGAPDFEGMYMRPIVGWISGVDLDQIGKVLPKTYDGKTGESYTDRAVTVHAPLPAGVNARIDILNLFIPGDGPTLRFDETSFTVGECEVNGERVNLADYLAANQLDIRLPLVADYCGANINASFQSVCPETRQVSPSSPEWNTASPLPWPTTRIPLPAWFRRT